MTWQPTIWLTINDCLTGTTGTLRSNDEDGNENVKKRFYKQNSRAWNNGRSTDNVRSVSSIVRANPWMTGHVVRSFGLSKKIQFWDNHDGNLFNLIIFPKKILTRGTFVCEIDDISCCQSRPQIGYCCACCKVLKIVRAENNPHSIWCQQERKKERPRETV